MSKSLYGRHNDVFLSLLRQTRESVQLRQADLARLLGRDQTTVSRVETGERRLDVLQLRLWLRALGVDFLSFMSELDQRLCETPVLENIHPGTRTKPLVDVSAPARRTRR